MEEGIFTKLLIWRRKKNPDFFGVFLYKKLAPHIKGSHTVHQSQLQEF
jgi:hypothetical protein